MAAENKKQKCATTVSENAGFHTMRTEGFPPNMPEKQMHMSAATDMIRSNRARIVGSATERSLVCPRIASRKTD